MTNNPFEKQIADKMNQFEVQPGEDMLQSIFDKRAARKKPLLGLSRLVLATAIISVAISAIYLYNANDTAIISAVSVQPMAPDAPLPESTSPAVKSAPETAVNDKQSLIENTGTVDAAHTSGTAAHKAGHTRMPVAAIAASSTGNGSEANAAPRSSNKNLKRFEGDNGANITERYFNINAKNRPSIASMKHNGNSHLYVYNSVDEAVLDEYMPTMLAARPLSKFNLFYQFENEEMLAGHKTKPVTLSRHTRKPVFIDLLFAPVMTGVSASGNPGIENYANSISKTSFNTQYGARISVPVSARISVFSGLFYQQQGNVYKGSIGRNEMVQHVSTTISYINDPVKGVIEIRTQDTVNAMEAKHTAYNFRNTYKLFQLPLGFSYNFGYKKFDFAIHTSALVNMFSHSGGQVMVMENNTTKGFSSSGKYVGIGGGFSVMAALKVSPRLKVIFEPGLQYFGVNAMKAGNNINEKVLNKQVSIGIRYTVF